jgi:enoyl-CoA hydratase
MRIGMLKSKELLFSGDFIDGAEAERIGMVNRALPVAELDAYVLGFAERCALVPLDALAIEKAAVNRWFEIMGLRSAVLSGSEFNALLHHTTDNIEFARIAREQGLGAALAARDAPFQRERPA